MTQRRAVQTMTQGQADRAGVLDTLARGQSNDDLDAHATACGTGRGAPSRGATVGNGSSSSVPPSDAPGSTVILFVRHAEVNNPDDVFYGRLPGFSLSDRGRGQATAVADYLATRPLAALYSSALLRARQTAAAIAVQHPGLRVRRSSLLLEVRSARQGAPRATLPPGFPTYAEPLDPGNETMEAVAQRMLAFIALVRRRHVGTIVACVSHGDPITILRLRFLGIPLSLPSLRGPNYAELCSVTEVVFREDEDWPAIRYLNVRT